MQVKLAEALLRRKELQQKVAQLSTLKAQDWFQTKTARKAAHEGLDDVIAQVPLVSVAEVTGAHDWHAKQLRLVDAVIQQANWTTELDVADSVMADYTPPSTLSRAN